MAIDKCTAFTFAGTAHDESAPENYGILPIEYRTVCIEFYLYVPSILIWFELSYIPTTNSISVIIMECIFQHLFCSRAINSFTIECMYYKLLASISLCPGSSSSAIACWIKAASNLTHLLNFVWVSRDMMVKSSIFLSNPALQAADSIHTWNNNWEHEWSHII